MNLYYFNFSICWTLVRFNSFNLDLYFLFDIIRIIFFLTVSIISLSVFIFRVSYIEEEGDVLRFSYILSSFVLSMFILIFNSNLISLILGWDGLGVSSYLLVTFYSSNNRRNSGIITFLSNRIGDSVILIIIAYLFKNGDFCSSWFSGDFYRVYFGLIIIFISCTKSAQIPFRAWLPIAIAAPTPVSALVHSSTLVTAGVWLLIRHTTELYCLGLSQILFYIGTLTILGSSISAIFEKDLKKIVALSTLSQLGIMIITLGIELTTMAYLHLILHAYFKAIIFIRVGNMIHYYNSSQIKDFTGGLYSINPLAISSFLIGSMSLGAIPFTSAFFSKEPIIDLIFLDSFKICRYFLIIMGACLTILYRIKIILLVGSIVLSLNSWNIIYGKIIICVDIRLIILSIPALSGSFLISPLMNSFKYGDDLDFTLKILILVPVLLRVVSSCVLYEFIFSSYYISNQLSWLSSIFGLMSSRGYFFNYISFSWSRIILFISTPVWYNNYLSIFPKININSLILFYYSNNLKKMISSFTILFFILFIFFIL